MLTLPLQLGVLGFQKASAAFALNTLAGLLLVELVARKWRRIPFTCTYVPAKRHLVHTILLVFTAYTLFVNAGSMLIIASLKNRGLFLSLSAVLFAAVIGMRRYRLIRCEREPVEFEDSFPDDVQLMPLSSN